MNKVLAVTAVFMLLSLGINAQADVFNLGSGLTNLETVLIGDAGNLGDRNYGYGSFGAVGYNYNIGKYEVTTGQYCDFLNHKAKSDPYGLYNTKMSVTNNQLFSGCNIQRSGTSGNYSYTVTSDWANRPVNYVSYWDACRFTNWLGNGQGDGDTETGAYTLNGYNGDDGRSIQRNAGWKWAVTSEDEWYKAAYYKGGSINAGYWLYPTQSNSINTGMANYNYSVNHTTNVGSYGFFSAYGTFDQGGNVWEWNESVKNSIRGLRGGSFGNYEDSLQSSNRYYYSYCYPNYDSSNIGFRVSEVVPEPSSFIVLAGGLVGLLGMRRRITK